MSRIRGVAERSRAFVKGRPAAQKVTAFAAVAMLVSAPFGGLEAVQPTAEKARVGEEFRLGPYEVTVERARTMPELTSYRFHRPEVEGAQLLVLDVRVHNVTDVAEGWLDVREAISLRRGAEVLGNDEAGQFDPEIRHLADGETITRVNPDVPIELAVIFEQRKGWRGDEVTLTFQPIALVEDDPLALDDSYWLVDGKATPAFEVTVPVEHFDTPQPGTGS